jgi:putative RNA 2'-phosphotransferase
MMSPERLVRTSKALSKYLRHDPGAIGLALGPRGWVGVDELLRALAARGVRITRDELDEVVAGNDKKRFAIDEAGAHIRAQQGHSVAVDLELEPAEPPGLLYHGTPEKNLDAIFREGLTRQSRHHVHLSADVPTAIRVGSRRGRAAVLDVDARAMAEAGHAFYRSGNGV